MERPDVPHRAGTEEERPAVRPSKAPAPWYTTGPARFVHHQLLGAASRSKQYVNRTEFKAVSRTASVGVAAQDYDEPDGGFDVIEFADRVVSRLLFDRAVSFRQVEAAWRRLHTRQHSSMRVELWRELVEDPEVDAGRVYEVASRVYAFRAVHVAVMGTLMLLQKLKGILRDRRWDALIELGVIPVVERGHSAGETDLIIFGTHDPMRLEIHRLLRELDCGPFEVRYVPEWIIYTLVGEAFPEKRSLIPTTLEGPWVNEAEGAGRVALRRAPSIPTVTRSSVVRERR